MDNRDTSPRSLKEAMRAIRIDEAERTGVVVALREADLVRLEILHDRLKPVFADVPDDTDLFDVGVTPGTTPRLWIDMIAFVEIGRDKRSYRFLQDTRHGRRIMIESDDIATVADCVTAYVARRLIERERLLSLPPAEAAPVVLPRADLPVFFAADGEAGGRDGSANPQEAPAQPAPPAGPAPAAPSRREAVRFSGFGAFVLFLMGIGVGIGGVLAFAHLAYRF